MACRIACKGWNGLEAGETNSKINLRYNKPLSENDWISVSEIKNKIHSVNELTYLPSMCNHCSNPACMEVCPENAIHIEDGFVIVDKNKCIGCGDCQDACIYGAINLKITGNKKVAVKCDACFSSLKGSPLCVTVCPTEAIIFDYRLKLIKKSNVRIRELKKRYKNPQVYGLLQYGGLNVLTLTKDKYIKFGITEGIVKKNNDVKFIYKIVNFLFPLNKSMKNKVHNIIKRLC